jgi:hypothetical protein
MDDVFVAEVAKMRMQGYANGTIANKLGCSVRTVGRALAHDQLTPRIVTPKKPKKAPTFVDLDVDVANTFVEGLKADLITRRNELHAESTALWHVLKALS